MRHHLWIALLIALAALALAAPPAAPPTAAAPAAQAAAPAAGLREIGRAKGDSVDLAIEDQTVATITFGSLSLYDIGDRERPRLISNTALSGRGNRLVLADGYAYVAWGSCGDMFTDFSCEGGADIFDLAFPSQPLFTARIDLGHPITDLAVAGDRLYMVGTENGVEVYDISEPTAPRRLPPLLSGDKRFAITLAHRPDLGGRLFAYIHNPSFSIIDLSAGGVVRAHLNIGTSVTVSSFVAGGRAYAYLSHSNINGLEVLDVTDPDAPRAVSTLRLDNPPTDQLLLGERLYVRIEREGERTWQVLSLAEPAAPQPLDETIRIPSGMAAANGTTLVVAGVSGDIQIFDIDDPVVPQRRGAISGIGDGPGVAAAGDWLLASASGRLQILDLSRPAAPVTLGWLASDSHGITSRIAGLPGYAIVGDIGTGWRVIDISEPSAPRHVATITTGNPHTIAQGSGSSANLLYLVSKCASGCITQLHVVDIADPPRPRVLSRIGLRDDILNIVVAGSRLYMGTYSGGSDGLFVILDLSNPAAPRRMSTIPIKGLLQDVVVEGGYAYIAAWHGGLRVIDVGDPNEPREIGSFAYDKRMRASAVDVSDQTAYLTDLDDGRLFTLDVSDPASPLLLGETVLPGGGVDLLVAGERLYAAGSGVVIYQHSGVDSGQVRDLRGAPVSNVDMAMGAGAAGLAASGRVASTGVNGAYAVSAGADSVITPSMAGYSFWPPSRTLAAGQGGQDFTLLPAPAAVSLTPDVAATLIASDTQGLPTTVSAPAGAVSRPGTLRLRHTVAAALPDGLRFAGHAFAIELDGEAAAGGLARPLTVTIRYSRGDAWAVAGEEGLRLYHLEGGAWADAAATCAARGPTAIDAAANTVSVSVCAPGRYALLGPTNRVMLPLLAR